ncbi:hypothetical protein F0P96_13965 [Hymenobacter busanensis]|uniref:Uncharacterized protein n=1 Tax=Hymenobacter busanensis TaxID=2607656 RepID=A0A7L5A247_9BACT|nr:carbohydrate binding domain-containing protein [Hymenobacter busanensis]KAA9331349.1 hypothetical protein F0P96_13965 [Hymenobacter busanensis]QHJ08502.1 hypothetical protein GUY19_14890 [Hymenobacter busanensis]
MTKAFGLLLLTAVLATACSKNQQTVDGDVITRNDFESYVGWFPETGNVGRDHAHSGQFAVKVDPQHEFGPTYKGIIGQISVHQLKGVHVEAWVYLPNPQGAKLGVVVSTPDEKTQILGDGIDLNQDVKEYKKWVKIQKDIAFPATVNATHMLKVFLWRGGATEAVYLDDISISALE